MAIYDFHTHTTLSDGVLVPTELARRAVVNGYAALGISDHVGAGELEHVIRSLQREAALIQKYWELRVVVGVELTHVPPESIAELAQEAKRAGAQLVVVHGESPVEPVPPGTDLAAASCPQVDILAHPGLIEEEAVRAAVRNGVFLEVSARQGHSLANGRVVQMGRRLGARFLLNTDTHTPDNLLTEGFARTVAAGAGLEPTEIEQVLAANPRALLERIAG